MNPLHYQVYGLTVRSCAAIDGLVSIPPRESVDVDVHFGSEERADGRVFEYSDARFVVSPPAEEIWCTWTSTPQDAATYLLGPVLAYALRRRGIFSMHASAIIHRGKATLFAGAPGAGKSTTAAACALRGATVITDDVAAIRWREGQACVAAGYPRLRLWGDVARALWGAEDALPLLTPTWNKRYVDLPRLEIPFASESRAIGAICVFAGRAARASLRRVDGHQAAIALLRHASVTEVLDDALREDELADVARLASSVPVYELTAPDDIGRAGEICDLLP